MLRRGAASTMLRSVSAPARWPSMRSLPRCAAQRPLPSIMIAVCNELCVIKLIGKFFLCFFIRPAGANQSFHVGQIAFERGASGGGQAVLGARDTAFELFLHRDV